MRLFHVNFGNFGQWSCRDRWRWLGAFFYGFGTGWWFFSQSHRLWGLCFRERFDFILKLVFYQTWPWGYPFCCCWGWASFRFCGWGWRNSAGWWTCFWCSFICSLGWGFWIRRILGRVLLGSWSGFRVACGLWVGSWTCLWVKFCVGDALGVWGCPWMSFYSFWSWTWWNCGCWSCFGCCAGWRFRRSSWSWAFSSDTGMRIGGFTVAIEWKCRRAGWCRWAWCWGRGWERRGLWRFYFFGFIFTFTFLWPRLAGSTFWRMGCSLRFPAKSAWYQTRWDSLPLSRTSWTS